MKYGKLVVMDNSYLSTKRMRLTLGHQKADFLRNVRGLRYIKGINTAVGRISAFYSGYKFFFEEQNWENGIGFGVGLGSLAFWEIGAIYGMGRMYIDSSAEQMRLFEEAKKVATPKEKFWINVWQSAGSPSVRYY